jgi:hypothetical protein
VLRIATSFLPFLALALALAGGAVVGAGRGWLPPVV